MSDLKNDFVVVVVVLLLVVLGPDFFSKFSLNWMIVLNLEKICNMDGLFLFNLE